MKIRPFIALAALLVCSRVPAFSEPLALSNPGFEDGLNRWFASESDKTRGLSKAAPEAARSGKLGLHVSQKEDDPNGSWLSSERLPVEFGVSYRLGFWARVLSPSGIGVWVSYLDAERQAIKTPGQINVLLKRDPSDWAEYKLDLTPPVGAAYVTIAIHGFSKHAVDADFDDFSLVGQPAPSR